MGRLRGEAASLDQFRTVEYELDGTRGEAVGTVGYELDARWDGLDLDDRWLGRLSGEAASLVQFWTVGDELDVKWDGLEAKLRVWFSLGRLGTNWTPDGTV